MKQITEHTNAHILTRNKQCMKHNQICCTHLQATASSRPIYCIAARDMRTQLLIVTNRWNKTLV